MTPVPGLSQAGILVLISASENMSSGLFLVALFYFPIVFITACCFLVHVQAIIFFREMGVSHRQLY